MAAMNHFQMGSLALLVLVSLTVGHPVSEAVDNNGIPDEILAEYLTQNINPSEEPSEVPNWPEHNLELGQVSGLDTAPNGDVIVFHRADKPWTENTFNENHVMPASERQNISYDTILRLRADTGQILSGMGANMFYVPHGLTVDKDGNLWLTDVGTHQVMKIPNGKKEPELILGEKFVPGNDDSHFCKPTDVAVTSTGDFFVSDGYCNSRVKKYSKDGKLIGKWGMRPDSPDADLDSPYLLNVPHSLALVENLDLICVADREDQRVLCYNAGIQDASTLGQFNRTLVPGHEIGQVYALAYDPKVELMYVSGLLSMEPILTSDGYNYSPARAFTYDLEGNYRGGWAYITPEEAERGPSIPHDIAVSPSGHEIYIADVLQSDVHKFTTATNPQDPTVYAG